jgi:subtilisin family serine protease
VDISGHGTGVLGIGAGNGGVAFESDLIVVKLGTPDSGGFPRTTQLMEGVDYCIRKAAELSMPAVVNLSFGNNYGAHNGSSLLEVYLDTVSGVGKNVICVGMGNEGFAATHTSVVFTDEIVVKEFSVGEFETATNLQLWKSYADRIRILIESPSGEVAGPLEEQLGVQRFWISDTQLLVYYGTPTPYEVLQEIYIDFLPLGQYLTSGIWKIRMEPVEVAGNLANLWLPVSETANARTRFLSPGTEGSFTVPAAARQVISVGAYDSRTDSYADFSGRAFQVLPWAGKPDLAAPGVDIRVPAPGGGYRMVSGTSFATPFVSGSAALLMEWGIVRGNDPFLFGSKVKAYLRRGARALPGFSELPNARVGYGALCVRNSLPE